MNKPKKQQQQKDDNKLILKTELIKDLRKIIEKAQQTIASTVNAGLTLPCRVQKTSRRRLALLCLATVF
jgi:hypothetical protein